MAILFSIVPYTTGVLIIATFILIMIQKIISKKKSPRIFDKVEELVLPDPPGPKPWPIIGSLTIMDKYEVPYKVFNELATQYNSPIIKLELGSMTSVVVNGLENIKTVLYSNGHHFDSRPAFSRYDVLFGGSRENSLAFCNWSEVHKKRRAMLTIHAFPRTFSANYSKLNGMIFQEMEIFLDYLSSTNGQKFHVKPVLMDMCGIILINYFTSKRFDLGDEKLKKIIRSFDKIFWEVNIGYAVDFLPKLMPFYARQSSNLVRWSKDVRKFIVENVVEDRYNSWTDSMIEKDYLDSLIHHVKSNAEPKLSWDTSLYSLEDMIGGHSAIGNFMMKVFGFLATRLDVQRTAQQEIDQAKITTCTVGLEHRSRLPYINAIILEAVRLIASLIVPHVANQDTSIAGYRVKKDTLIFLNNYDLAMSEKMWDRPNEFMPERFIKDNRLFKPDYFIPFGGGRRSCMGYKLVKSITFVILTTILKNFTIHAVEGEKITIPIGHLATRENSFRLRFEER